MSKPLDILDVADSQVIPALGEKAVHHETLRSSTGSALFARCVNHLPKSVWALIDVCSVCLGHYVGYRLFQIQFPRSTWVADMTLVNAVVSICFVASGVLCGLYDRETLMSRARILVRSILTVTLAIALAYVVMHALMYEVYSRRIAILGPLAFIGISGSLRMIAHRLLSSLERRILFVGCGDSIQRLCRAARESDDHEYALLGYVSTAHTEMGVQDPSLPHLGSWEDIQAICLANDVHEVVIGVEEASEVELTHMIMTCLRLGCRVTNQPTFYERVFGEVPVDHITSEWFLFADLDGHREERATLKRMADAVVALGVLVVSIPLWPMIAAAIRLEDRGPVFYSQRRVGRHNRIFRLTKFRTMRQDAEADGHAWAIPNDPRVTRVGWFLRRTHLDELPQLWNILLGDMSLIGPRPERPEFVEKLIEEIPYYDERHLVRPGLTGWAQVNYRYGCSIEDARRKLFLDLYYIKHMSQELDLVIACRTVGALFGAARYGS